MKIGAFSKACGLSQDTVRFYIKSGLLMPAHEGAQYAFTENDVRIVNDITALKGLRFSLQEIKSYLSLIYLLGEDDPIILEERLRLFEKKKKELQDEISERQSVITRIDEAESTCVENETSHGSHSLGVPIAALQLLCCPECHRQLNIHNARLDTNYVYAGTLCCECGYSASIVDGIIDTGSRYSGDSDHPDLERVIYRASASGSAGKELKEGSAFITRQLYDLDLSGKVLFEGYTNNLVYTCHNLNAFPDDCVCILVDKFPEVLRLYKMLCERRSLRKKIVFIASSNERIPIKQNCIDIMIDYFGENENSFYSDTTFFSSMEPFLKRKALVLSAFSVPKKKRMYWQRIRDRYPECALECPDIDRLKADMQNKGFKVDINNESTVVYSILPLYQPISLDQPLEMTNYYIIAERK